jgi:hypothetical protein
MCTEARGCAGACPLAAGLSGILLGGLLLAAWPVGAAAQPAERLYQVELVIFQQPEGSTVELPPLARLPTQSPASEIPGAGDDAVLPGAESDAEAAEEDPEHLPAGFGRPLLALELEAVAARLNRGGYQLLWHQAWVQPALEHDGVALAWLAALGQGPAAAGLAGTVALSAGRFLHLGLKLEMQSARGLAAELHQQRRIRATVEQYFDHPVIGAVALVRPVAASPDQPPASVESTP